MSIRSMKTLTSATKVCNICRHLYHKWRRENLEYSGAFDYMESSGSEVEETDTNSVRRKVQFFHITSLECLVD